MESTALVSGALESGDGFSETYSNEPINRCSSSAAYFSSSFESGSELTARCDSSPETESTSQECSMCDRTADLLHNIHFNDTENAQQHTDSFAEVNCLVDHEANTCKSVCNCGLASPKPVPSECCNSYTENTDATLIPDVTNFDTDARALDCDNPNDLKTDNTEDGSTDPILPHPTSECVVVATKRCSRATPESCSSVHDDTASGCDAVVNCGIEYRPYGCEQHLYDIIDLVSRDLSEPYSIYTYRYFIYNWPSLCFRVSEPPEQQLPTAIITFAIVEIMQ